MRAWPQRRGEGVGGGRQIIIKNIDSLALKSSLNVAHEGEREIQDNNSEGKTSIQWKK